MVPLSPTGNPAYEWVSTSGGATGVGILPAGAQGNETDGSTLSTPVFSATAGTTLNFFFNYVTSDGAGFADYAWAELYSSSGTPVALLFTARTEPSGSIIPGTALPPPAATLMPVSVPILPGSGTQCGSGSCNTPAGGPAFPELGAYTGDCWASGCGYTGWVKATYVIPNPGNYYLKVGVVNWLDQIYDSALAVDGVTIAGVPITLLSGSLDVEYGTDAAHSAWLGLVSATDSTGKPLDMKDAAQKLGYDHFNWLQIITKDLQLAACAANTKLTGCSSDFTMTGAVPTLPTVDPPLGGYAYELCPSGPGCQTAFPAQDYWPPYLDEYFSPVGNYYTANPSHPEYFQEFRAGNTLATMGANNQSPSSALGFSFSDAPNTNFKVPGTASTPESITFVDSLIGVSGSCNVLVSSNCAFQIIPGTTFQWSATNGVISPSIPPGGPGSPSAIAKLLPVGPPPGAVKQLVDFPVNPVDFTGAQLATSIITVNQFLSQAGLTTQSLTALGGSVAPFSASLIPSQALALSAVKAGGTVVTPQQISITTSGLAFSRVTQTFNGTLTLKNTGSSALTGPFQVFFPGLPPNVSLVNATGNLVSTPYLTVSTAALGPGQSITVAVQFKNPSNAPLSLAALPIYSGTLQ